MAQRVEQPVESAFLEAFGDVSAAVEAGAGLPEVARAVERALDASVAVVDTAGSVLAVACRSPDDERAVLSGGPGREIRELRVADTPVGELRYRPRGEAPPAALVGMVGTLIALEVERSRAPERASEAAVADFVADLLERRATDRDNIVARGRELGNFVVDHTQYDTTSILATIEARYDLAPLSSRDAAVNDLSNVFQAKQVEASN